MPTLYLFCQGKSDQSKGELRSLMAEQIVAASSKPLKEPSFVFRPPPLKVTAQDVYDRRAKASAAAAFNLATEELVVVAVFRYLTTADLLRCGVVCRAWHQASLHPSLWHTVDLTGRQDFCSSLIGTYRQENLLST